MFYVFHSIRTSAGVVEIRLLLVGCLASPNAHELHEREGTTKYRHALFY